VLFNALFRNQPQKTSHQLHGLFIRPKPACGLRLVCHVPVLASWMSGTTGEELGAKEQTHAFHNE
jgi:hypothetical protein